MYNQIINKEKKIAVIGLGYVGLPIALAFARKVSVIGFNINSDRIEMMKRGVDPSKELVLEDFQACDIHFTSEIEELRMASFYIIAVPTPIDNSRVPNLKPLFSASNTVGQVLEQGDYVVFESTVYPGCTEEDCLPILEKLSGLKLGEGFKIGYSPERINPGDKERTIEKIVKVVSGSDGHALNVISDVYKLIIDAGVFCASSIKVAEAAKVIENTQRDLNIALMNELSVIFDKMDIATHDVLEAAGTKWNFLKFFPGLVGGHCIGVDPYYLTYKAKKLGYTPQVILSGRRINDNMSKHVATKIVQILLKQEKILKVSNVLVMGVTFKENVSDIRNSKVADVVYALKEFSVNVDVVDPCASSEDVEKEYGFSLLNKPDKLYDAIVVAVAHDDYKKINSDFFVSLSVGTPFVIDLKNIFAKEVLKDFIVWRL